MENSRTAFNSTFFASAAIFCFIYGAIALFTVHVLRPEYANHMVSDYAVGRFSWLMTSCFLAMSMGCLTLLLGLLGSGPTSMVARVGTFMLGMAALGLVISAIYPTDVKRPVTHAGYIHFISFVVNITSILLAAVLLSIGFGSHARWRTYQRTAVGLTSLLVLAFVLQLLTIVWRWHYALANRFFIITVLAWLFAASLRLRAVTTNCVDE